MATTAASVPFYPGWQKWFLQFVKSELAPYPGRANTVARLTIAVVLTFLLVMTFRIPNAAITLYTVFTITRESSSAAVKSALFSIGGVTVGVALSLVGALLLFDEPLLHFLFILGEFFLLFWLLRAFRQTSVPTNMGLAVYTAVLIWTYPYPAERHLEQTLWVWASLSLGCTVAVLVELIFTRTNAVRQIIMGVTERLDAVETLLRTYAQTNADIKGSAAHRITGLAIVGTGRLRRQIRTARSNDTDFQQYLSELSSAIALVGRLVDVSANMLLLSLRPSASDTIRLQALVREMARIRQFIAEKRRPEVCENFHIDPHVEMPLLPELEKTVALLPQVFTPAGESGYTEVTSPIDQTRWERFLVPDAWTNRDYIRFAIKGCLAVTLCYVLYTAVDWPGIATSVLTCFVTMLSTLGASRQKQILRLTGAAFGGLLGIASLVFIVPNIESITAMTLLIAAISSCAAWVAVSSPHLSYFGLQMALAFYLTTLQDFSAPTSLAPARDRFVGVLLGLTAVWIVDHLWHTRASDEVVRGFRANLRLIAQLVCVADDPAADRASVIQKIRDLRDLITTGFSDVQTHASTMLFEFGPDRRKNLALRERALNWQSSLRTIFLLQISILQYRIQVDPNTLPLPVRQARIALDNAISQILESLAEDSRSPNIEDAAIALSHLESELEAWFSTLPEKRISTHARDILGLSRQLVADLRSLIDEMTPAHENIVERGEQVPDQMLGMVQ
jgi:multidrug resistance protein MdtO